MNKYYTIEMTEDGIEINSYHNRESLLKELEERLHESDDEIKFFTDLKDIETRKYNELTVIEGNIVIPQKKEVATKYFI